MTAEKIINMSPNLALLIWVGIGLFFIWLFKNRKTIKEIKDGLYDRRKKNEEYKEMLLCDHTKTEDLEAKFDELNKHVEELTSEMRKITEHVEAYDKHRQEDRAVSIQYRNKYDKQYEHTIQGFDKLTEAINAIGTKIDENQQVTDARFKESEEKTQKRIRAELKDKIMRAYRLHHQTKRITQMELEALEGLIEEYFSVKGNSFVEKVVQPEMYTWSIEEDFD